MNDLQSVNPGETIWYKVRMNNSARLVQTHLLLGKMDESTEPCREKARPSQRWLGLCPIQRAIQYRISGIRDKTRSGS